jgi:predicted ATPase
MTRGPQPPRPLDVEDWSALKDALKRFEDAWRQGPRPAINDYLPADGGPRRPLLVELVHVELELRLKAGEPARVEDYLARYLELVGDRPAVLELIEAEYYLRRRDEPLLGLEEYQRRFPQYAPELAAKIDPVTLAGGSADRDTPHGPAGSLPESPPVVTGYEVLGPLGRGGMGVVYKARQLSLNRLVALKLLPEECARDPVWLERFRHEALTASALNHPHICTIHDSGECAGRNFLSMELIEGRSLEELINERLPAAELANLIAQAARALAAAHAAGVVHRDIKPQNLMVRDDGIVKVLDFGLSRRIPCGQTAGPVSGVPETDPGTLIGTVLYMSPEQARAEPVGTASDIFSLGVVLYELAAGRHPFLSDLAAGVLHAIASESPLPASRLNPEVPAALEALIQQMLSKDPRLRPTALEVDASLAELTRAGFGRSAVPRPGPGRRPTVGRRQELAALHAGFESAVAGQGLLLCVSGEPGLGKTTVVEDFLQELEAGERLFGLARGRCSERLAGTEAYLPFLEALDGLLQGADGASSAQVMKLVAPTWYVQLAPLAAGDPSLSPVLAEARGATQERRKRELGLFLQEMSRRRPLVVFLDDVHWVDPSSVDLLAYLGGRCAAWRLLVLLTYRPSDLLLSRHPFGPVRLELQGRGVCREVALSYLTREDVDRYLALAFAGHRFPEEFAAAVHARTGGNPLFLVDLLCYLRDEGVLVPDQGCWAVARAVPDLERELPESVRSMVQRKLDQVGETDRHLLLAASVQGMEFDAAVAARLVGREAIDVEERLDALERVHALVRRVREHEFPDGTLTLRYRFVHVLYQNALYASLLPTRKAAWSGVAAEALLNHYGEKRAGVAAVLALLFEAARQPARAVEYFLLAARNAVQVSAHAEAVALASRGLALLERQPDTPSRGDQELPLLLTLGVSLVATKGFASPEVEQAYARARALCLRADDTATLYPVLYGLWNVYLLRCELTRCKELATQMFDLARRQSDAVLCLQGHNVLQQPLLHLGDFADARRHQEQGLAQYDPHKHGTLTAVYGEDPGISFLAYGAVTLWCLGYPDQALRSVLAARRLAEELSHPFNVARALYFGAFTHLCRREVSRTQELAEALMELSVEQGFALLRQGALILHGWCLAEQGRAEEGIGQMRQGLAGWQATGALSHRPYQLALLAQALAQEGQAQDGLTALDEALALATSSGERFLEAELHRLRGELFLTRGGSNVSDWRAAEGCFCQALDVARQQNAKSLELRAVVSRSRLFRQQGRPVEARALLAESYGWFTEGFETCDLREAKALLGEVSL